MATCRTFTSAAALLLCASTAVAQAPANDDCVNATVATVGNNAYDATMATLDGIALDPLVCDMGIFGDEQIYNDVWFSFTPASDGAFDIASVNNGAAAQYDSRIAVYDGACPGAPADVIVCDDDAGPALEARVNFFLIGGTTYLIRVGAYGPLTTIELADVVITSLGPDPANTDCANAIAAPLGNTPYDNGPASDSGSAALDPLVCDMNTFGDEQIYNDLWFTFTPAATDFYDIGCVNNGNAPMDSRLAIYDGACPGAPADVIACDDDAGPALEALVTSVPLTIGVPYLIRVGSFSPQTLESPAELSIAIGTPPSMTPANDDCANAQVVTTGLTAYDSSSATDGTGLELDPVVCDMGPFGDEQIYQDVWFSFTAPSAGGYEIASVNNGNASWDGRIAVYNQSTCPDDPANVIGCDDDAGPGLEPLTNVVLAAAQTVLVRVGSYNAFVLESPAALSIVFLGGAPGNDDCANATAIAGFGNYAFDTTLATTDGADLAGFCDVGTLGDEIVHDDVWFSYTATTGGCTYISTLGLVTHDSRIAVYDSTTCPDDPATVIACSDDEVQPAIAPFEAGLDVDLVMGNTYLIRVGNFVSGAGGAGSMDIMAGPVAAGNDMGLQPGAPGCTPGPIFTNSCNGDGGNQMGCTDCPCGNNALPLTIGGCVNSSGGSTRIDATGDTSVSLPSGDTTDLRLTLSGAPAGAFCVMLSGGGVAPLGMANPCFGLSSGIQSADRDGLRCAVGGGQAVLRHGGRSANGMGEVMDSSGPSRVWGGEAQPAAGIAGQAGFVAGQTRQFQVTHREDALAVCMRGLNTSQALEVTFTP